MINSKQKGNRNEREACKFMERWTGQKFIRVANSGAMHSQSPWLAGDIVPETTEFLLEFNTVIETKHLKYLGCLDGSRSNSVIGKIMNQCLTDKERVSAANSLCLLRQNGMKKGEYIVVVVNNEVNNRLPWFLRLDDLLLFNSSDIVNFNFKEVL